MGNENNNNNNNNNDNNNNNEEDSPLPSEMFSNPFSASDEVLSKIVAKEIGRSLLSNPTEVAYIKTSSGEHIISRTIVFSEDVLLLVDPSLPQYVPDTTLTIDENGDEKVVNGMKVRFFPYSPLSAKGAMVPLFINSINILTKASDYLTMEYNKTFPLEKSILSDYATALLKDTKKIEEKKKGSSISSNEEGEKEPVYVLDDGRVIHRINKTVN